MRIKKSQTKKKEEVARRAFAISPKATPREVNDEIFKIFGSKLSLNRVYLIKKENQEAEINRLFMDLLGMDDETYRSKEEDDELMVSMGILKL